MRLPSRCPVWIRGMQTHDRNSERAGKITLVMQSEREGVLNLPPISLLNFSLVTCTQRETGTAIRKLLIYRNCRARPLSVARLAQKAHKHLAKVPHPRSASLESRARCERDLQRSRVDQAPCWRAAQYARADQRCRDAAEDGVRRLLGVLAGGRAIGQLKN